MRAYRSCIPGRHIGALECTLTSPSGDFIRPGSSGEKIRRDAAGNGNRRAEIIARASPSRPHKSQHGICRGGRPKASDSRAKGFDEVSVGA